MNPWCFSCTVNVVGAVFSTGFEGMFSIHTIRSNGGNENGGLSGKVSHLDIIEIAYFDGYIEASTSRTFKGENHSNSSRLSIEIISRECEIKISDERAQNKCRPTWLDSIWTQSFASSCHSLQLVL